MKLFISWSGERSRVLAVALHAWIPMAIPSVESWLSEADVYAGERWAASIGEQLDATNFGIVCVTPENINAPWMLFKAGALAKSINTAKVVPLLYGLDFADISGPLAQFQAKKFDQAGVFEVVNSIQATSGGQPNDARLAALLPLLWPQLEVVLAGMPPIAQKDKQSRPQREVLEELVGAVRSLEARSRDEESDHTHRPHPRSARPGSSVRVLMQDLERVMDFEPMVNAASLLVLANAYSDIAPWLGDMMRSTYQIFASESPSRSARALEALQVAVSVWSRNALHSSSRDLPSSRREMAMILLDVVPMHLQRLEAQFVHLPRGDGMSPRGPSPDRAAPAKGSQ